MNWAAGDINRLHGINGATLKRYADLAGYPPCAPGERRQYMHRDVEAFVTVQRLQRALTGNGGSGGGLSREHIATILSALGNGDESVTLSVGPGVLQVTRVSLDPPTGV